MRTRAALLFAVTAVAMLVAAGGQETDRLYFKDIDPKLEPYGFASLGHLWMTEEVHVCWENPDASNEHGRQIVEKAIVETWGKATHEHLIFTKWAACTPGARGVHIRIADDADGPRSLIGTNLDGKRNGVRLNMTFRNWEATACGSRVDDCIRTSSIHEFGHVLGLLHENKRPETPTSCLATGPASHDDSKIPEDHSDLQTAYDAESIMNYCNKIYQHHATLSDGDRKVAERLYRDKRY